MRVIGASAHLLNPFESVGVSNEQYMLCLVKHIEVVGRTCYKSEAKITDDSYKQFVAGLIRRNHSAILEHSSFSIKFIVDRGISHELVRHRIASFAQESTRYCNYGTNGVVYIKPQFFEQNPEMLAKWFSVCELAEQQYTQMIQAGRTPQEARSVLPNSTKTEVIMTANFREWRHFFNLRAANMSGKAHPQMLEVTRPLLKYLQSVCPIIFDDIVVKD